MYYPIIGINKNCENIMSTCRKKDSGVSVLVVVVFTQLDNYFGVILALGFVEFDNFLMEATFQL